MTTRYVDAQMAFQGPRKVWAAGTASADSRWASSELKSWSRPSSVDRKSVV